MECYFNTVVAVESPIYPTSLKSRPSECPHLKSRQGVWCARLTLSLYGPTNVASNATARIPFRDFSSRRRSTLIIMAQATFPHSCPLLSTGAPLTTKSIIGGGVVKGALPSPEGLRGAVSMFLTAVSVPRETPNELVQDFLLGCLFAAIAVVAAFKYRRVANLQEAEVRYAARSLDILCIWSSIAPLHILGLLWPRTYHINMHAEVPLTSV